MNFRIIRNEDRLESRWSGGRTYELAIFPEHAKYLDRDFLWRLSTADSDRDESSFTKLPDYDRILMVLEGDVVLAHGDERSAHLEALQQDSFDGAIKTRCFGRLIRDYNLIYRKGCEGRMELAILHPKASAVSMRSEAMDRMTSYGVFCLDGYAVVSCGEQSEMIRPGEQAVIDFPGGVTEDILLMGEGRCILTEIIMPSVSEEESVHGREAGSSEASGEGASNAGTSGAGAAEGTGNSSDYLTALKLYLGRNRWAMIMRREGKSGVYYDRELSQALRKLERKYLPELIWIVGVLLCCIPVFRGAAAWGSLIAACIFTLVHLFGIVPALYRALLPTPFSAHMKPVEGLNAAERAFHEEEISEDPHFEKLMNKYKQDEDNYFADESSPLYRLMRKK